ncbi:glutamate 5-kinase [Alkalitalea saponilacus]|uniref:Glutamate 5-kinase n=1 Tax=Alkalitalea saponilacus TaxID=889453 RepID=A0A1T5AN50_9BACT|nr:glutamate 5-kinase [Alkalitalea saponilacus]SKB36227.1 glutamate 5-kinase [Alkalitalea saponilacus]
MYKSITIKIGSNVLTRPDGKLDVERMAHITDQIAFLHKKGVKVILVSSGAVAAGRSLVNYKHRKDPVSERQLLSSVGQVKLVTNYASLFDMHKMSCAQVLVTKEDFRTREHYLNMKNCISVLLNNQIVPIINENDAVSVTALMFTDNDELAGLVASMMNTEALFILTNVDGIFNGNPNSPDSQLVEEIDSENVDLTGYVTTQKSNFGRGGMLTKGRVAQSTAAGGISVHIANGTNENVITLLASDAESVRHTRFLPGTPRPAVKKWMAYSAGFANSEVHINEGARQALFSAKATSLLLAGVTRMEGDFKKGDLLKIIDFNNKVVGIGKAQYDRKKADEHKNDAKYKPLVHYDYLYLFS